MEEIRLIAAVRVSATGNYLIWIDCELLKGSLRENVVYSLSLSTQISKNAHRHCNST